MCIQKYDLYTLDHSKWDHVDYADAEASPPFASLPYCSNFSMKLSAFASNGSMSFIVFNMESWIF